MCKRVENKAKNERQKRSANIYREQRSGKPYAHMRFDCVLLPVPVPVLCSCWWWWCAVIAVAFDLIDGNFFFASTLLPVFRFMIQIHNSHPFYFSFVFYCSSFFFSRYIRNPNFFHVPCLQLLFVWWNFKHNVHHIKCGDDAFTYAEFFVSFHSSPVSFAFFIFDG